MDSYEISEWMAYDLTNTKEWIDKHNKRLELEKSKSLTMDEKLKLLQRAMGGKGTKNGR